MKWLKGDRVRVQVPDPVIRMDAQLNIIHEDTELLVVNKPAGLVCHPTKGDAWSSLISRVRMHAEEDCQLHMIHRLDRETSGVCLFAKTDESAKQLRRLFERRLVQKKYQAIVHGWPEVDKGRINAPIGLDEADPVAIKRCVRDDGAVAATGYRTIRRIERAEGRFVLLAVQPESGRTHQIRVHLAHIGHPIVGDKIYGGDSSAYLNFVERRLTEDQKRSLLLPCQALHAAELQFAWNGQATRFEAEPETSFTEFVEGTSVTVEWSERYV